ncbi:MAG: hypothetical protein M3Q98_02030 [Actinomycetota bacterium]|nr:hypothetical protein [Actinomycetota bacterium]
MGSNDRDEHDRNDEDFSGGSGDGGTLGTPSKDADEAPSSYDQDANEVVSGGGLVGPDEGEPSDKASS